MIVFVLNGTKQQISYWVNLALDYNPAAKASAKKSAAKKK